VSSSDNFGKNRNKFRRVYGYGLSRRPEMMTFLDPISNEHKTVDSQKFIRDRDFFHVPGLVPSGSNLVLGEYVEAQVGFAATEGYFVTFPTLFSQNPIVTVETSQSNFNDLDGSSDPNIVAWVTTVSTGGFAVAFSAPFSGTILYRAIYSPTYPVQVDRSPLFPGTLAFASAGTMNFSFETAVTMSWDPLSGTPQIVDTTPTGSTSDTYMDVFISQGVSGSSSVTADLSTAYSGTIAFIAIQ
jgi:hypothetical protein